MSQNPIPEPITTLPLQDLLDSYAEPAILMDKHYVIHGCNSAYVTQFGQVNLSKGLKCYEVSHSFAKPCDQEGESCPMLACVDSGLPDRLMHVHVTSRGREYVEVEMRPIAIHGGKPEFFLEILKPSHIAQATPSPVGLVGASEPFNQMLDLIRRVAPSRVSVFLSGASGTGKEVVARAIHDASDRSDKPFVPVECSGLTESLFESELFGHEKGAFTGAYSNKKGLVEAAHGGTLFLDEIGDVPMPLQVKLLRLLETKTYRKVGSVDTRHTDFRLISATNQDLTSMVESGTFRLDLYYRISVFPIHIPSLSERKKDIPLLIETLLQRMEGFRGFGITTQAVEALQNYDFPGNIRELLNFLERASLLAENKPIDIKHLPQVCQIMPSASNSEEENLDDTILSLKEVERRYIKRVLTRNQEDRRVLAEKLGVSERTLYRKIEEANLGGTGEPSPSAGDNSPDAAEL
ncbi:MAG: sigma 54-interacting transcriptional regulator [Magnetococcales bacterium]|nr:sigma 54-interacting transcriptional regulator [Magnetococcales bacterium]